MCVEWTWIKYHVIKLTNINIFLSNTLKLNNEVGIQAKANRTCNLNAITLPYPFVSNSKKKAKSVDQNNNTTNSTKPNRIKTAHHTQTVQHLIGTLDSLTNPATLFDSSHKYHPTHLIKLPHTHKTKITQHKIEPRKKMPPG